MMWICCENITMVLPTTSHFMQEKFISDFKSISNLANGLCSLLALVFRNSELKLKSITSKCVGLWKLWLAKIYSALSDPDTLTGLSVYYLYNSHYNCYVVSINITFFFFTENYSFSWLSKNKSLDQQLTDNKSCVHVTEFVTSRMQHYSLISLLFSS